MVCTVLYKNNLLVYHGIYGPVYYQSELHEKSVKISEELNLLVSFLGNLFTRSAMKSTAHDIDAYSRTTMAILQSLNRLVSSIVMEISEDWETSRIYINMETE